MCIRDRHMKAKYRLAELDEDLSFTEKFEMAKEVRLFELNKLDSGQKKQKQVLKKKIRVLKELARKANMIENQQLKAKLLIEDQVKRERQLLEMQKKHSEQLRQGFEQELRMREEDFQDSLEKSLSGSTVSYTHLTLPTKRIV